MRQPATAGRPIRLRYTATTWAGVRPMLFSTPILWYPATTAPLTTLPTMSTAITRPISANATTKGSMIAPLPSALACVVSQGVASATAPAGSARLIVAASARAWA